MSSRAAQTARDLTVGIAVSTIAGTTSEDGAMSTARKRLRLAQQANVYSVPASHSIRVIQSPVVRSFGALRLPQDDRERKGGSNRPSLMREVQNYGQDALVMLTPSTHTPGADTASSDPIRNRNVTVCPARFGPMLITVSM